MRNYKKPIHKDTILGVTLMIGTVAIAALTLYLTF